MIEIKKIIYWHFYVYNQPNDSQDPYVDPANLGEAISTLSISPGDTEAYITNAKISVRSYSMSTGREWLIQIPVNNEGSTEDLDSDGRRSGIRANNTSAAPGFVWFDLAVNDLITLYGNPVVVDNLQQMSDVDDGENGGARQKVKYALFAVHKLGESGGILRSKPDDYFSYFNIPQEVVDQPSNSYDQLQGAMRPKMFVDSSGKPSGFFVNIKSTEIVDKLGCCEIVPSSSSSGVGSSSSSGSVGASACIVDQADTIRDYYAFDDRKRIWAVRQTADIHAQNIPVRNSPLDSSSIIKRRHIFSELIWADVSEQIANNSFWNDIKWNHAGYIGFRDQLPKSASMHIMPSFNRSNYSTYHSLACLADSYDYNFEMPIAIQSIGFDERGSLWALCSGGFKDNTPVGATVVSNIETTEGIYRLIPGGWKKKPADVIIYGGAIAARNSETEELNKNIIADIDSSKMSFGFTTDGKGNYFAAIDSEGHIRLWKQSLNMSNSFPDDTDFLDENNRVLVSKYISCGYDKIVSVSTDNRLYAWTCNSLSDSTIISKIDASRSSNISYSQAVACKNGIVALRSDGNIEIFAKDVASASDELGFNASDVSSIITEMQTDSSGPIVKIVGGRLFVAVLTQDGRIYAKGKMGNNITIEYDAGGVIFTTLRGNGTFRSAGYRNISVCGEFLASSYINGDNTEFRFVTACGLDSVYRHNSSASAYDNVSSAFLDNNVLNNINQFYYKYGSNSVPSLTDYFYDLIDSKGLFGICPRMKDGSIAAFESDKFDVFESSELILAPKDFTNPSFTFDSVMRKKPSLFGWQVEFSPDGSFAAVSAPGDGFTGPEGFILNQTMAGKVYIYHKKDDGYKIFQILSYYDLLAGSQFGKFISFAKGLNASGQEVLKLFVSVTSGGGDSFIIYETSSFGDNPIPFSKLNEVPIRINGDTTGEDSDDWRISSIKSYSHITVICKSSIVSQSSFIQIINNNATIDYDNAAGGYLYFINFRFSSYDDIGANPAANGRLSSISISQINNVYNLFVGSPDSLQGNVVVSAIGNNGATNKISVTVAGTTSTVKSGYLYNFAFTMNGNDVNFSFNNNIYFDNVPYRTPSVSAGFGFSIDSDEKQIVVGSPFYGNSAEGEINVYSLIPHPSITDIVSIDKVRGSYNYNFLNIKDVFSTSIVYPASVSNRFFGSYVKIVNNRIIVSASDVRDTRVSSSQDSLLPGEIYILESNLLGDWTVVGSNSLGHVGDRYGKRFDVHPTSGGGFDILIGASGYVGGPGQIGVSAPSYNDYAEGIVKILSVPGASSYGCVPSKKINKIIDPDSNEVVNYKYDQVVLGKRHFAGFLTNTVDNRYVWDYNFAQLLERSVVDIQSGIAVPKFKIAKFSLDPVTGSSHISTYSDLGAFSMEQDVVPAGSIGATDVSVADMPLYITEDRTIRVMEMHPKPFRDLDASADSISSASDASSSLPAHVDETDPLSSATYLTPINSGTYNLFSPIVSPSGENWVVGNIELSKAFAITPVRSNRWTVPVESMNPVVYDLYNNKIAIYTVSSNFQYISKNGFTLLNDISEDAESSVYTDLVGNPIKKIKNILLTGSSPETWWSSGNYISPGCIQVVDSGFHGPCAIGLFYPATAASTCATTNNLQRTLTKLGGNITPIGQPYNYLNSNLIGGNSNLALIHAVDGRDLASYRMAAGGININWDADILNLNDSSVASHVTATSKFLGWSGCTVGCAPDVKKNNDQPSQIDREKDNYDYVDLFNGAVSISGPPVILKTPCFGAVNFTFNATNCPTRAIYSGDQYAGNDKTQDIFGWNACLYFKGKKDSFIHGVYNQHERLSANVDPVADRRSQIITYFSGFGSVNQKIYANTSGSNFPHVLLPSLRFSCLLDKRISTLNAIRKNFSNYVSGFIGTQNVNQEGSLSGWMTSPNDESSSGNSLEKPNRLIAPTDTVFLTDLFFNHYNTGSPSAARDYINNAIKDGFSFASSTAPMFKIPQTHYTAAQSVGNKFGPSVPASCVSRIYSVPNLSAINNAFYPLVTSLTLHKNVQYGTSPNINSTDIFSVVNDLDLFSGYERYTTANTIQSVSFQTIFTTIKTPATPPAFANVFKTSGYAVGESYKNVLRYPYKTSILTGRGRCVQISPFNTEKRSIGREEIVYQNEFIYRRLRYFFPRTTKNTISNEHNCSAIKFSRNVTENTITISSSDNHPEQVVDASGNMNLNFVNAYSITWASAYCSGRRVANWTFNNTSYNGNADQTIEVYPEVKDAASPASLINGSSLVCLPTFSVPYMFEMGLSNKHSFIFAATLMNNAPSINYAQQISPETSPQNPDYNLISINRSNMGTNLSAWKKLGLNNTNSSTDIWWAGASAFILACSQNKAHIIDINTSVVALGAGQSMASVMVLASVNANAALEGGDVNGPNASILKRSRDWSNGVVRGGGLVCININCRLNSSGRPIQGTFNSTMDISTNANSAVIRDIASSGPVSNNNTVQSNIMRNGLWLQPILGLRARDADIKHRSNISNDLLNPNSNFSGNTPHYWPGNHVKINDNSEESGWLPPCRTSHIPKYVPTGSGMVKVPANRAWLTKLGKHKMLYGKKGSGASSIQTWYSIIGPFVYCINQNEIPSGSVPSPNSYLISERMSCFKMPAYVWDSRPIVFQRFGISETEANDPSISVFDFKSLDLNTQVSDDARKIKSFYRSAEITSERSNTGSSPNNAADIYYFDRESLNYNILPTEDEENNSFAMLGEGTSISFVSPNGEIIPIIFWRDAFYILSKESNSSRPSITKYEISCNNEILLNAVLQNLQNSYSLFRQNSYFNEKDKLVIAGNIGAGESTYFIYIIKISISENGLNFDLVNYNALANTNPPDGIKNISGLSFGEFSLQCNQAWRYSLWMSSDSNIVCIGKHRWSPEEPDDRYTGWSYVSTSDGNPKAFFVDVLSLDASGNYVKIPNTNIIGSNSVPLEYRPIESMCESIWGTRQTDGLWKIHCISGQEPTSDYLRTFGSGDAQNTPTMKTKVHVFEARAESNSGIDNLIELNNLVPQSSSDFSDLSYNNMNFWTLLPISAKNGSCGIAFIGNTLAISSGGHIIKATTSGGSSWTITGIKGQSSGGLISNVIEVSRVESPYVVYGQTDDGLSVVYANNSDIKKLKTICVPSCINGSSVGFHNYANKISPVVFNVGGIAKSYIATISNTFSDSANQIGIFDINTQLQNDCNPAFNYLRAGKTDDSDQRYNPSLRAWLQLFSSVDNSFGVPEIMPYVNYSINSTNNAHVLVKPPSPSATIKRIYFAGSDAVPMDVSMSYRDYDASISSEIGTMLQSDWHDVAGLIHWGDNIIYVVRSYDYRSVSIGIGSATATQEEENWIYKKSYYKDQNGISVLPIHGFIKYEMPLAENIQVPPPSNISAPGTAGSRDGIGMTGPKVITVAATANKFINYNGVQSAVDSGAIKDSYSFITPLLKNRRIFGNVRVGIVVQDDVSMNSFIGNPITSIRKMSSFGRIKQMNRFNANDVFISNCIDIAQISSSTFKSNNLDYKQSGFSCPNIFDVSGSDYGYSIYVSKFDYIEKSNNIWNKVIDNISKYLNPNYGSIFNSDKIWISRLSYVYEDLDSTHLYPSWHFAPVLDGQGVNSELSPFTCTCGEALRKASRSVAKWKPNKNFVSSNASVISAITGNASIESQLQKRSLNSSNPSEKLTDLVLIGNVTKDHIEQARNIISVNDNAGLLNGIEISMYNSGANSIMAANGSIHIVDTSDEFDDEKTKFMNDFCARFKGFYTRLKGK